MKPPRQTTNAEDFEGVIYRSGVQRCVLVPAEVVAALGGQNRIPVLARVGRSPYEGEAPAAPVPEFQTTLMSAGDAGHKMFVSGWVRRALNCDTGDTINVSVRRDPEGGETSVPDDLMLALRESKLLPTFEALTPRQRREMVSYAERAASKQTRARYIGRILDIVEERRQKEDGV